MARARPPAGSSTSSSRSVSIPSAFVGALLPASLTGGVPATARRGSGAAFVVEADEYAGNFDAYRPAMAVVTNLEWDHPDVFADRAAVIDAVEALAAPSGGAVRRPERPSSYANVGDAGAAELAGRPRADWPGSVVGDGARRRRAEAAARSPAGSPTSSRTEADPAGSSSADRRDDPGRD